MNEFRIPLTKIGNGGLKVTIDLNVYSVDAITSTCYKYTDRYYIHQQTSENNDKILNITFETKDENVILDENTVKQFCNDLIDQQVRVQINRDFGHIRDLIVEEAFKPVSK